MEALGLAADILSLCFYHSRRRGLESALLPGEESLGRLSRTLSLYTGGTPRRLEKA